jgi:hypothetical protein
VWRRLLAALALVVTLGACGGEGDGGAPAAAPAADDSAAAAVPAGGEAPAAGPAAEREELAQLWVTRDGGSEVILTTTVPAGLTVLQALDREADVETRYGGRFVQAIDGIEGSLTAQQDWFYFLNGVEPDVGAAEVRLRPGDIVWWDFRSWAEQMQAPVVVGAFPEPFLHGFDGRTRPVDVRAPAELGDAAAALELLLGEAGGTGEPNVFALEVRPGAAGATLVAKRGPANDAPVRFVLSGELEAVRAAAMAIAEAPEAIRFRYRVEFDEQGRVLP